jgi:DNA repair protein RAD7
MSRNNVRGPTSALTEFLKVGPQFRPTHLTELFYQESGITPTTIARRREAQRQPVAGPSNALNEDQENAQNEVRDGEGEVGRTSPRQLPNVCCVNFKHRVHALLTSACVELGL